MHIVPHASLSEFFKDAVHRALTNQHVCVEDEVEAYLVNLLSAYSTTTTLNDEPLGVKLASAQSAAPEERIRTLRDVGDTTLYLSGFFAESLQRRLVDVDYYISLGGSAYGQLAQTYARRQTARRGVYDDLGHRFGDYVEVLAEVSQESALGSQTGVMQLYERWVRTGSKWAERRLRRTGLVPSRGGLPH